MKKNLNPIILIHIILLQIVKPQFFYTPFAEYEMQTNDFLYDAIFYKENTAIFSANKEGFYAYNITNIKNSEEIIHFKQENDFITSLDIVKFYNKEYLLLANEIQGACLHDIKIFERIDCFATHYQVKVCKQFSQNTIICIGESNLSLIQIQIENNNQNNIQGEILKTWNLPNKIFTHFSMDNIDKYMFISNGPLLSIVNRQKILNLEENIIKTEIRYVELLIYTTPLINLNEKLIYVLDVWRGLFLSDITKVYSQESVNVETDIDTEQIITQSQILTLQITKNQKQLILGYRTNGIKVYDIADRYNPFLLQTIPSIGASTKISLSNSETQLIYCNGQNLKIFQQMIPNLSSNIPNLFNGLQGKLINDDIPQVEEVPWRAKISQDSKWLYIAGSRNGAQIFSLDDPYNPQYVSGVPVDQTFNPTDGITISPDGNTLLVGEGIGGVKIVDVQDKQNYEIKSKVVFEKGDADDSQFSNDMKYMIVGHGITGVSTVDITNLSQPEIVSTWVLDKSVGQVENVLFNNDNTQVWASLRFYGVIVLEFNPYIVDMKVIGDHWNGNTEMVSLSNDEQFGFFCDGNVGIRVANITDVSNIQQIKIVELGGFPGKFKQIQFVDKYDYLFISQQDSGLLSCVNVTDPMTAEVTLKYDIESDIAYDVDCTKDNQYCYLITNSGIRVLPLINQLDIHKEFRLIQNGKITEQFDGSVLPIGKKISVILIPLRSGGNIQINNLYHYKNFILDKIPSYMYFDRSSLTLTIEVNKEGLKEGQLFQNNIILIQLSKQIKENTFINDQLSINLEKSEFIRQAGVIEGYLDEYYFINPNFNPRADLFNGFRIENDQLNFQFTNDIVEHIRDILINSLIQVPLTLNFVQSLFFNPQESKKKIITTESDILNVKIEILDKKSAEFVILSYTGALVDSQVFMMSGNKDLVLQILTDQLLIQDYYQKQNIQLKIQIDDTINHIQEYQSDLEECQFLQLHKGIIQDKQQTLQQQFDKNFQDGLYIQDNFMFQFGDFTFQSDVGLQINYDILFKFPDTDNFVKPENGSWLQVNLLERKIEGYPPASLYRDTIHVKVLVSDGYDTLEDQFEMKIQQIPGILILQIVIGVCSPIITLLGLIKYRGVIYGICCKKLYKDGKIFVKNGESFKMQLILGRDQIKLMTQVYNQFKILLAKEKKSLLEFVDYSKNTLNTKEIIHNLVYIIKNNNKFQTQKYQDNDILSDIQKSEDHHYLFTIIKCFMFYDIIRMKENQKSFKYYLLIKSFLQNRVQNNNQWFKGIIRVEYKEISNCQEILPEFKFNMVKLDQVIRSLGILKHYSKLETDIKEIQTKHNNLLQCSIINSNVNAKHNLYFTYESEFFQEIVDAYQENCKFENLNLKLIFQTIITDNIGFKMGKGLKYSNGITINCEIKDISTVAALVKSDKWYVRYFPTISKILNVEYQYIPMVTNSPLPEWLTYGYHHDIFELQGVWESLDQNNVELMIRIINIHQITVKEFLIYRIHEGNIQKDYGERNRHSILQPQNQVQNQLVAKKQNITQQKETYIAPLIILPESQIQDQFQKIQFSDNNQISEKRKESSDDSPKFASVNQSQKIMISKRQIEESINNYNNQIKISIVSPTKSDKNKKDKNNNVCSIKQEISNSNNQKYTEQDSIEVNSDEDDQQNFNQFSLPITSNRQFGSIISKKNGIMPSQSIIFDSPQKQQNQQQFYQDENNGINSNNNINTLSNNKADTSRQLIN